MQTIWTRVAPGRGSCRCPSCLLTSTLSRRTTTAAPRRKLKGSDVFVACYSAIFASATLIDAKGKEDRKAEWKRLIEEARQDTAQSGEDSPKADASASRQSVMRSLKMNRATWADTIDLASQRLPKSNAHWQSQPDNSSSEERITYWKLDALESSVIKLVAGVLVDSRDHFAVQSPDEEKGNSMSTPTEGEKMEISTRLSSTQDGLMRLFCDKTPSGQSKYPAYDRRPFLNSSTSRHLNDSLTNIVKASRKDVPTIRLTIAEICHSLLSSRLAPNATTYEILIRFFSEIKMQTTVTRLLDSFYETRLRPSERLISTILQVYIARQDFARFHQFIRLMRGLDGGLGSARRKDEIYRAGRDGSFHRGKFNILPDGRGNVWQFVEKAPRDQIVFQALIKGSLAFYRVEQAMMFYRALIREGLQATIPIFADILACCVRLRDWRSGMVCWREMKRLVQQAGRGADILLGSDAYRIMLTLCESCNQDDVFEALYKEAQLHGIIKPEAALPSSMKFDRARNWRSDFLTETEIKRKQHRPQIEDLASAPDPPLEQRSPQFPAEMSTLDLLLTAQVPKTQRLQLLDHILETEEDGVEDLSVQVHDALTPQESLTPPLRSRTFRGQKQTEPTKHAPRSTRRAPLEVGLWGFDVEHPGQQPLTAGFLPRNQVPEWSESYIDYKGLKKAIKLASRAALAGGDPDLAGLFFKLDRNVEGVSTFYDRKYAEASRRLSLLQERYERSSETSAGIHKNEIDDFMGALLELRGQFRKLQWYAEVNRRGFVKITKKLDKKVPRICAQRRYMESLVDPRPFATNADVAERKKTINAWLSKLAELKSADDSISIHSAQSVQSSSSQTMLELPPEFLNKADYSIRQGDAASLSKLFSELAARVKEEEEAAFQKLVLNLLQRAISCGTRPCIDELLSHATTLDEEDNINGRNCIHRFIITLGRSRSFEETAGDSDMPLASASDTSKYITPAAAPIVGPSSGFSKELRDACLPRDDEAVSLFEFLLDKLRRHQRSALQSRDIYGRLPLHYAAQIGVLVVCEVVVEHMLRWDQFDVSDGIDAPAWQDQDGWAPLHLSVTGGHPLTTKYLLESEKSYQGQNRNPAARRSVARSSAVLALAVRYDYVAIVKLLVDAGVDIDYQDEHGETALHIAARFGHEECARILLDGTAEQQANPELMEKDFAWTPLFVAAVDGHLGIVEILIEAGVELEKPDLSGWTVKEHAALRGHMNIARRLAAVTAGSSSDSEGSTVNSSSPPLSSSFEERTSRPLSGYGATRTTEPVKTFGHRYLTDESMILVSLGTMDMRKAIDAVKLDRIPLSNAHLTKLDTALSLVISANGASGEPSVVDLPVQDNINTEPVAFTTTDPTKVKIMFDIVPTYAGTKDHIVGRGVALLASVKPSIGSQRMSLQGDVRIPIVAADTLDVIGTVNFNFLIIKPFLHPNISITENQTYWKSLTSTMLIGHRDVQLTKDHVPVIYHDFLVSETGIDAPVHTLTLEQVSHSRPSFAHSELMVFQFLHVNDGHTPHRSRPGSPDPTGEKRIDELQGAFSRRTRSLSLGNPKQDPTVDMSEKMKHTRDFKIKGYKGNSRGNFIQAPFTTLEEMFKKLPESIGFNIELKYPMLHESEEQEMDTIAVELNSFVDTVLQKVYDLGKKRNVILSSFNPDVCLLLSLKQPSIPILFLTDAGTEPVGDIRASSLQEAIRFASRWNLLGVVTNAEPLVTSPRLVKVVKESGLVCVSYGTSNNDPEKVQLQVKEGIDAVIVDSVLAIRKGLTGGDNRSLNRTQPSKTQLDPSGHLARRPDPTTLTADPATVSQKAMDNLNSVTISS
ncbi:MAG: methyltransferase protein [Chaenotheca gracillima]|nr:MAG: methyltransferase protein [Chaenotheca gracillima]